MANGKDDTYGTWDDFRAWATGNNWCLVIYDPVEPVFLTPTGVRIMVKIDHNDYVTDVMSPSGMLPATQSR